MKLGVYICCGPDPYLRKNLVSSIGNLNSSLCYQTRVKLQRFLPILAGADMPWWTTGRDQTSLSQIYTRGLQNNFKIKRKPASWHEAEIISWFSVRIIFDQWMSLCDSYILAVAGGLQHWDPLSSASCQSSASQKQLLYVGTQTSVLMGLFMECSVILILSRAVNHGNSPLLVKNARVPPRVHPIITCCWRPVGGVCWVNLLTLDTPDRYDRLSCKASFQARMLHSIHQQQFHSSEEFDLCN